MANPDSSHIKLLPPEPESDVDKILKAALRNSDKYAYVVVLGVHNDPVGGIDSMWSPVGVHTLLGMLQLVAFSIMTSLRVGLMPPPVPPTKGSG